MPRMKIFNSAEQATFENPPIFNSVDRKKFFEIPSGIKQKMETLRNPTNKVCFLITFGYFRATRRFFVRKFHRRDLTFVAKLLDFNPNQIKTNSYGEPAYRRHKKIILKHYGLKNFDEAAKQTIKQEIHSMIRSQLKPALIMRRVLEISASKKIEIPTYNTLANLIVEEMKQHKQKLTSVIESSLTGKTRQMLDTLLEKEDKSAQKEASSQMQRYKLTLLKKFNLSTRPKKVKANIEDLQTLKELFYSFEGIITALNLTYDGIKYYAVAVIKAKTFQVSRKAEEDRYLHLLTFVIMGAGLEFLIFLPPLMTIFQISRPAPNTEIQDLTRKIYQHPFN